MKRKTPWLRGRDRGESGGWDANRGTDRRRWDLQLVQGLSCRFDIQMASPVNGVRPDDLVLKGLIGS